MSLSRNTILLFSGVYALASTLAGCDFTEDCHYTGSVGVRMDWSGLASGLPRPDTLSAFFYHPDYYPEEHVLAGDTAYGGITAGETTLFLLNLPQGVEMKRTAGLSDAVLELPTRFEGNLRVVDGCPLICSFRDEFMTPVEDTIYRTAVPRPLTGQIILKAHILREGVTAEVDTCTASLSGISTVYALAGGEASRNDASVCFPLAREGDTDTFMKSFFVLGVSGDNPNRFAVTVRLEDGETRHAEIDLSEQLAGFKSGVFEAEMTITLTALGMEISIGSWNQGEYGDIIIQ